MINSMHLYVIKCGSWLLVIHYTLPVSCVVNGSQTLQLGNI